MSGRTLAPALPLVVAVLALTAGCIGGVPVDVGGTTSTPEPTPATPTTTTGPTTPTVSPESTPETLAPQSYPWKPDPLRAGNVEVYVREYERTVRHNELVGQSVIAVEQTCQAALVAEVDAGYLVRAECGGSIHQRADGGATSVGAISPERVTYFVNDSIVERIAGEDRELDPYRAGDGGLNVATPESLAVVNADDEHRDLRVEVAYEDENETESVLGETLAVAPGEGVDFERVAAREGFYNVSVEMANETAATYRWQVDSGENGRPGGVGVVVTSTGDVVVVPLPWMR